MKRLGFGLAVMVVCSGPAIGAESPADAIKAFGLIGVWSVDCARDPIATCEPKTGCGARTAYEIPSSGVPMIRNVVGTTVPGVGKKFETIIESATRLGDEKIRLVTVQVGIQGELTKLAWARQPGERWDTVLEKTGNKYRVLSYQREDGKKISARDGLLYTVPPGTKPDEVPENWLPLREYPLFERCLNEN